MRKYFSIFLAVLVALFMLNGCGSKKPRKKRVVPVVSKHVDLNVNITGAAGELNRLTMGGLEELVSKVSDDGRWMLVNTYSISGGIKSPIITQKLNIPTKQYMILTPKNSTNADAVWTRNTDKFIFSTNRAGGYSIVESMGVNGESGVRFVTTNSLGNAIEPSLNRQKNEIAFSLNGNLALVNLDGTQVRMFGEGRFPKLSNDGSKILFIKNDGKYKHIFTMRTNGTSIIQLTNETANEHLAVWSPDDRKIAFISDRTGHNHLYSMDINGKNLYQLTDGNFDVSSVDWGRDGWIYFSANAGGSKDLWRLKLKGE